MSGPLGASQWMYKTGEEPIAQSLKFNDDESQYLSWTPASAGNRKTWTWSGWVKRGNLVNTRLFNAGASSASKTEMTLYGSGALWLEGAGSNTCYFQTAALFRDVSAWYHFVVAVDTTQATSSNRVKLYVNGEQITAFDTYETYPAQNSDFVINSTTEHTLGKRSYSADYSDMYLADVYFIDGTALDPTNFGETVDGYWKPKEATGLTYGTNGFHLTFQDDIVSEGFNTVTYRGTGATQSVSGLGFSPDLVWIKNRTVGYNHLLSNTVTGITNFLNSNTTSAEFSSSVLTLSSDADGFSLGTAAASNGSGNSMVAWCWDAGTGSAASNTQGSITSTVKANPSYGFSVVSYSGASSAVTVGHGLGVQPDMMIVKNRTLGTENWAVYHKDIGAGYWLLLSGTNAALSNANIWNNTAPTSSVFSVGLASNTNVSGSDFIAYCFHSVSGYSSFGSYSGTGATGNAVTGLGFKPAFLMVKRTDSTGSWAMFDNTRANAPGPGNNGGTSVIQFLQANVSNAEGTSATVSMSFDSDGFTVGTSNTDSNASGGTYIYMAFADTREYAFWKDVSGNGNHWTPNNLDYRDSLPDTPSNSFAVFNALAGGTRTLSEGNLKQYLTATSRGGPATFTVPQSGKWYWETMANDSNGNLGIGVSRDSQTFWTTFDASLNASYYANGEYKIESGTQTSGFSAFSNGDILSVAVDADVSPPKIYFGYNGTWQNSADPAAGTGGFSLTSGETYLPMMAHASGSSSSTATMNFGQDSTFAGAKAMGSYTDDNGIGNFQYAPPTGYLSLCTSNLTTPTIVDGSQHFNTVLYTGDGANPRSVSSVNFQPDFVWIKGRSGAGYNHVLNDSVRGGTKTLFSNDTAAEYTDRGVGTFDTDGFTFTTYNGDTNNSGVTYASWNWKAGGTAVSNTDGSVTTQVSANPDAGFSILSWTTQSGAFTTGHGLSQAPEMFIEKNRTSANNWTIYHKGIAADAETDYLLFTTGAAADDARPWNDTAPTSTVIHHGNLWHAAGQNMIGYAFHSVDGFSKVGSFSGNGTNQFVYTGFRPAFLLIKRSSNASGWYIFDSERGPYNPNKLNLSPNTTAAESTAASGVHFHSNGFEETGFINDSGQTVIYLAIASTPFKFSPAR